MIKSLYKPATPDHRGVITLLLVIIASSGLLILINYFTIKTLSAVRAYTEGESSYSKGQKDASRNLISFTETGDKKFWIKFEEEIAVPLGDSIARVALTAHLPDSLARKGFIQGLNHPDDLDNMIWLFHHFKTISFMKDAIQIWKEADGLVARQQSLGYSIYPEVIQETLSEMEKVEVISQMNHLNNELTVKELAFAGLLGEAARTISRLLFYANFLFTVVIIGSVSFYASKIIRRLREKNQALMRTNLELDKFVYSVSHDLRAPITSLKGLISIARDEEDRQEIHRYWGLMLNSLNKQDQFIKDIISFSRNKRAEIENEEVDLKLVINEVLEQLRFMNERNEVQVDQTISAHQFRTDAVRLKIVLSNLISNAFKYGDPEKPVQRIQIKSYRQLHTIAIEICDNGIGIDKEYQSQIFDMFFVTSHSNKGTGLGLYIVKETVERLKGKIMVESTLGAGTKFIVSIPV
jgi:signal transduction histidine kinase